ncbi:NUDIX domain-containing protein [Virgibacillus oceani]
MANYNREADAFRNDVRSKYITPDGYKSDIAVFTIISKKSRRGVEKKMKEPDRKVLKIMLIKRAEIDEEGKPNIEGDKWALPGRFIDGHKKETAREAAARELEKETGVKELYLKHFGVYDKFREDARGWIISNAYYAIVSEQKLMKRRAAYDASEVKLFTLDEALQLELAFDHRKAISDAAELIKKDMVETTIARNFLPEEFTLSELQRVLQTVTNTPKIRNNSVFFAKVPKLDFIDKVYDRKGNLKKTKRNSYRPSQLYKFNDKHVVASIWE